MFLMSNGATIIVAVIGIALFVILLVTLILVIVNNHKKQKTKVKVNTDIIQNLIKYLGGKNNIKSYKADGSRVRFEIANLALVNLEGIKSISAGGVFVTGLVVKVPFAYSSADVIKMLDGALK